MSTEEKLDLYKRAFYLITKWAEECDFGYDNIDELYQQYKKELEEKDLGYLEGLLYIALKEAESGGSEDNQTELGQMDFDSIEKVDKAIG